MPIPTITIRAVIDILAVAFIVYQLLEIVRGTRAGHILLGILAVLVTYEIALRTGLEALRTLLASLAPYTAIAIIVLFQSEIRRTLARLGRKRLFGGYRTPESTAEILLALSSLSSESTGALIILERDIGLRTFIESGVRLDAQISRDLLLSIFKPGTALHDGSVIIQKDRLAAAACFLPLTVNPAFSTKTGTRHRAGIGITEETDCLSLIVSEETGMISVAAFGDIEGAVTIERVEERIRAHFGAERKPQAPRPRPTGAPEAQRETAESQPAAREEATRDAR